MPINDRNRARSKRLMLVAVIVVMTLSTSGCSREHYDAKFTYEFNNCESSERDALWLEGIPKSEINDMAFAVCCAEVPFDWHQSEWVSEKFLLNERTCPVQAMPAPPPTADSTGPPPSRNISRNSSPLNPMGTNRADKP
jgi:hypothetical protein